MAASLVDGGSAPPRMTIFDPFPVLTVTIEDADGRDEVHLHAGGQGLWIGRMAVALGARVRLVCATGGESGVVLTHLIRGEGIQTTGVTTAGDSAVYVHDRRSGGREELAEVEPSALSRHELDGLYEQALVEALDSDVFVLAGPRVELTIPPDTYRRLGRRRRHGPTEPRRGPLRRGADRGAGRRRRPRPQDQRRGAGAGRAGRGQGAAPAPGGPGRHPRTGRGRCRGHPRPPPDPGADRRVRCRGDRPPLHLARPPWRWRRHHCDAGRRPGPGRAAGRRTAPRDGRRRPERDPAGAGQRRAGARGSSGRAGGALPCADGRELTCASW